MLVCVTIHERGRLALSFGDLRALLVAFPSIRVVLGDAVPPCPALRIDVSAFRTADLDAQAALDSACDELAARGAFALCLEGDGVSAAMIEAVLTRQQRFLARRNRASAGRVFERVLACHRALHDRRKPLVRADHDHALDTWQWLLRLEPSASLGVQVAALFHDIERLASEADERVEHRADDYRAFKREHARRGAAMARAALADTGLDRETIDRVAALVACHEQPDGDPERRVLNEADALSFFSLNSAGFLHYFGIEHTRRKVAYTLARLRQEARWPLARLIYHPTVAELLRESGIRI